MARLIVVLAAILLTACDQDRVARLEKETKELRAELDKQNSITDLDTQAKCADAAKRFLHDEFPPDRSTIFLDQHNHYNKALGKCFVTIEWHYTVGNSRTGSWHNFTKLFDAYQRDEYGSFSMYTYISLPPDLKSQQKLYQCRVAGRECKSIDEFMHLSGKFME